MRLLLYTDPHISSKSSIITGRTGKEVHSRFSSRLDKCISTFEWINNFGHDLNVDKIVCLGDLVDNPTLSAEELSAISVSNLNSHTIILGNHDIESIDGFFNSVDLYGGAIKTPQRIETPEGYLIIYLPYSKTKYNLSELRGEYSPEKTIFLSHNDIKGIYYGKYLSQSGYDINDIRRNCLYFINGHLHVGKWVIENQVINLGTCTGLNFNNVGGWSPSIAVLNIDKDKVSLDLIENPYAYIFNDFRCASKMQVIEDIKSLNKNVSNVVQFRVPKSIVDFTREEVDKCKDFIDFYRIMSIFEKSVEEDNSSSEDEIVSLSKTTSINIYDTLREFVNKTLPSKYDLDSVLSEIKVLEEGT